MREVYLSSRMPRRGKVGGRGVGQGRNGSRGASFVTTNNAHLYGWQGNEGCDPKTHFSLNEEARNTEHHRSWNSDLKLRYSRVTFVSAAASNAGDITQNPRTQAKERTEDSEDSPTENGDGLAEASGKQFTSPTPAVAPEIPMSNMSLSDPHKQNLNMVECEATNVGNISRNGPQEESASLNISFIDVNGSDKPVYTGFAPPKVWRTPSPAASDSSEEVILFAGRKASYSQAQKKRNPSSKSGAQPLPEQTKPTTRPVTTVIEDSIDIHLDRASSVRGIFPEWLPIASQIAASPPLRKDNPEPDSRKGRRGARRKRSKKATDEAEILADYIANTHDSDELVTIAGSAAMNRRDLGGSDNQWQGDEKASAVDQQVGSARIGAEEWDSADLQDFDELSTSSEAPEAIERILSKRERTSGIQYLVVGEGYTMDDARWLPISLLDISGADEQIQLFEEEQAELERLLGASESSEDSLIRDEKVAMDLQDDLDDLEDERDLEERRKDRMTDEQIARLLSKQEEFGLGSRDLLLFDGEDSAHNVMEATQLDGSWGRDFQIPPSSKRKKRYQDTFPSATLFADLLEQDPYNGFDVMDQERPSLRKRPKGPRGKLALGLSDSELEQSITIAWENDRTKKKVRKQEREELRAQGLLGKKVKVDMKAKYAEGMSIDAVKREIREFLLSSAESLSLPPMAQKERKIVHEIANVFRLKSKSIGGGSSRFPVLYRTARTIRYDAKALNTIEATLSSKRFLPRFDKAKNRGAPVGKARGGFASAGVSYRDGEVVGAAAPELGQENRGRAMLEKMGWSTGTALGALNNTRGIVQPVTQVVKTGKAGLG